MEKEAKRLLVIFWVIIILETSFLSWLFFQKIQEGKERLALKLELKQTNRILKDKDGSILSLQTRLAELEDVKKKLEEQLAEFETARRLSEGEIKGAKEATQILAEQFQDQHNSLLAKLSEITSENRKSQLSLVKKIESLLDTKHKLEIELASMSQGYAKRPRPSARFNQEGVSLGKILVEQKNAPMPPPEKTLEGRVLSVDTQYDFVIVDLGKDSGIKPKDRFFILRRDRWIGEVEIEEVYKNMSLANIVPGKMAKTLRRNDKVVPAQ